MFQITVPCLHRQLKTSEPRFTRLNRLASHQQDTKDFNRTAKSNFPLLNRETGLDNSKENLSYETHLMKIRSACKLDETTIVSTYLNSIRKDYDGMSKNSKLQLTSMRLKKREIQFMKMKNKVFTEQRQELELKISQKYKQTSLINDRYEEAKMQTKILDNIIERMKNDQIFYKQFGRIRDEEVKKNIKETKLLEQKLIHQDEKLQRLTTVLNEYKSCYNKNQELRQKKFQDFAGKISDVQQRDKFIQERKERTYELQSIELNDTLDEKNIHMRDIILAHKVADSLLELKVNHMIKRYSNIQSAFHLVKLKTCISEPQVLVSKFFSYQQTAEGLLESISQHQRRIQQLILKKAKLAQQYEGIITQNLSISDGRSNVEFENDGMQKYNIIRDINDKHLLKDQIYSWIQKKMYEFHSDQNVKNLTIENKFSWFCHNLCQSFKKYQNLDLSEKRPDIIGLKKKKLVKQQLGAQISIISREGEQTTEINHFDQQHMKLNRQNAIKKGFSIKSFKRDPILNNK